MNDDEKPCAKCGHAEYLHQVSGVCDATVWEYSPPIAISYPCSCDCYVTHICPHKTFHADPADCK